MKDNDRTSFVPEAHPRTFEARIRVDGNARYCKGHIRGVTIYSNSRTAAEVAAYAKTAPNAPDKDHLPTAYDLREATRTPRRTSESPSWHENIVPVLSGHDPCNEIVVTQTKGEKGNTVTPMLVDPRGADASRSAARAPPSGTYPPKNSPLHIRRICAIM